MLLLLASAWAHDHWIEVLHADHGLDIRVLVGEALESSEAAIPKDAGKYPRFLLDDGRRQVDLSHRVRLADPLLHVDQAPERGAVIAADARAVDIVLEPEKFSAYLAEEGITGVTVPDHPVHERYTRHLKAVLSGSGRAATRVIGQELEIVPLRPPGPGRLRVEVLFHGQPLVDAAVGVATRDAGGVQHRWLSTDDHGRVTVVVDRGGQWLVHLVHLEADASGEADFRSWWASLGWVVR